MSLLQVIEKAVRSALGAAGAKERIVRAKVTRISLCRRGKNDLRTLAKSGETIALEGLAKSDRPGELLAVVYAPESPDADGHVADAETIREMAHDFMLSGHKQPDFEHDGKPLSEKDIFLAESFIVPPGDARFADWKRYDDQPAGNLTGAWATVYRIPNPSLAAACRAGEIDGVSLFGRAAVVQVEKSAADPRFISPDESPEMTKEELTAALADFQTKLESKVSDLVKSALKPAEPKADPKLEVPEFKGDPTNVDDLRAFEKALRVHEIRKAVAGGEITSEKLVELIKSMSEGEPSDEDAGIKKGDSDEVRRLKRDLAKAQRRTNQPSGTGDAKEVELEKAYEDEGAAIAALLNAPYAQPETFRTASK